MVASRLIGAAVVALAALGPAAAAAERPSWCAAKPVVERMQPASFRGLAQKLRDGAALKVVTVGSSSTEGSDLQDRSLAYPTHLRDMLEARLGAGRVTLVNRGRGGESISDTFTRFARDVTAEHPDLVVWQLGANDIARRLDPETSRPLVAAALQGLARAGVAVVLMDSQNAPKVALSPVRAQTDAMLRQEAAAHGAAYWSRFALMEDIVAGGAAGLNDLIRSDGLHMTVPMHVCTGAVLAEMIVEQFKAPSADLVAGR